MQKKKNKIKLFIHVLATRTEMNTGTLKSRDNVIVTLLLKDWSSIQQQLLAKSL